MKKKILYVSDLDGTLLRSDQTISDYSIKVINSLVEKGVVFSYATARGVATSSIVTKGLDAKLPIITHNGTFIVDNQTHEIMDASFLDEDISILLKEMFEQGIYPTVYAIIDGKERFSNYPQKSSKGTLDLAPRCFVWVTA